MATTSPASGGGGRAGAGVINNIVGERLGEGQENRRSRGCLSSETGCPRSTSATVSTQAARAMRGGRGELARRCGWLACGCGAAGHGAPRVLIAATWVGYSGWRGGGAPPAGLSPPDLGFRPGRDARCKRARRGLAREGKGREADVCRVACFCLCRWGGGQRAVWPPGQKRGHVKPGTVSHAHMGTWRTTGGGERPRRSLRWLCCAARPAAVAGLRLLLRALESSSPITRGTVRSVRPCLLSCRGCHGSGFVLSSLAVGRMAVPS